MNSILKTVAYAGVALSLTATAATAQNGSNPIFGGAKVTTMTAKDNAAVAGKGAYANYYGYYGEYYAYQAWLNAYYGRYVYAANSNSETNAYLNAYIYSYYATDSLYYAYVNSAYRQ